MTEHNANVEATQDASTKKTNYGALTTLTTVFFFWGFIAAGNSVFIPFCKSYFTLDQFQSQLIDFAFYLAYYLGALLLFVLSSSKGKDIVGSWGYKKSIVYGLLFSALGAATMIFCVEANSFIGMLIGLFIVALGFSLQQTSANPFMIALGDEKTGSSRITLGGAINSFGTMMGPLVVSLALFGSAAALDEDAIKHLSLSKIIMLYACVGGLFILVAALFGFSKSLPASKNESKIEKAKNAVRTLGVMTALLIFCFVPVFNSYRGDDIKKLEELQMDLETIGIDDQGNSITLNPQQLITKDQIIGEIENIRVPLEQTRMFWLSMGLLVIVGGLAFAYVKGRKQKEGWGAMAYPQMTLGMLAIFVYVGVEVALASNLGELLKQPEFDSKTTSEIAPYVAMFWGSMMIGRWTGAIGAFDLSEKLKQILRFIVPLIAFCVVLLAAYFSGYEVRGLYYYIICVLFQIVAFWLTKDKPAFTLLVFSVLGVIATCMGVFGSGTIAIYGILSAGLFCSIMWPCIFSLSLAGLGKYQAQGSAFLVMMILGGSIIPPLQGKLADIIGIQTSYLISVSCFVFLAFFAYAVKNLLKKQGLNFQ